MKQKNYRGQKAIPNLYPNIINEFPPHSVYWELFAGSAGILRKKAPCKLSVAIDKLNVQDLAVKYNYHSQCVAITGCGISYFKELRFAGPNHLVYLDPPYSSSIIPRISEYYKFILTDEEHLEILNEFKQTSCMAVISHYPCALYDQALASFRSKVVNVNFHGKIVQEKIWFNFPPSAQLHQTTFTGKNKTERQQYKRMAQRWLNKFENLPYPVRQLIMSTLDRSYSQLPGPVKTINNANEK